MIKRESKKRRLNLRWLAVTALALVFVASAFAQDEPVVEEPLPDEELQMLLEETQMTGTILLSDSGWSKPVGTWDPGTKTGTLTTNVSETIQIVDNNLTLDGDGHTVAGAGSGVGVYLNGSTGVTIQNLNVQGFIYGIYIRGLFSSNILTNNTTTDNRAGITLKETSHNSLTGNTASNNRDGIVLTNSSDNTLTNNSMSGNQYNLRVTGREYSYFNNDIDTTNTVEGKPIYYVKNATNQVFDSTINAGVFYAINCDNITIKDLSLTNDQAGVYLWDTHNSSIENIDASNNGIGILLRQSNGNNLIGNTTSNNIHGIVLEDSSNNTLTGNTTSSNNRWGISLRQSSGDTLTGNTVFSNNEYGIFLLYSSDNQVYNNNFIANSTQAYVNGGSGNLFNLAAPTGGNHWSNHTTPDDNGDGFVDNPYVIDELNEVRDNLPWVRENGWALTPQEAIQNLIDQVATLNLQKGIDNSLDAKLDAAFKALDDVNANNDVAAINALQAFINAVEAQRGNKISDADADALIATANDIIAMLSSP